MINYKYCPYCGKKSKRFKEYFECSSCTKKVYINSRPATGAFAIRNGKYLISKRAIKPQKGYYDVVGGFLKNGEDPKKGVLREFKEETGATIKIIDFLGIYMDKYKYQDDTLDLLNICYVAEIVKVEIKPQDDVASLHWFPLNYIPKNLAFDWLKTALKDLNKKYKK